MVKSTASCNVKTNAEKFWEYDEYYIGDINEEGIKSGHGENHWSGAKSLECYNGQLFADTMHGLGEYRWRFHGREGVHCTYEGYFYCNSMHGYGTMSYPDGRVFTGLFHSNIRWGPGVETHASLKEDVGLWCDRRLIRLAWRPQAPSIAPDFNSNVIGKSQVEAYRVLLAARYKIIGETNSAIDLLKQYGADPKTATEIWSKLYPSNCTDLASLLCNVENFEHYYYKDKIALLEEVPAVPQPSDVEISQNRADNQPEPKTYFAWNNNKTIVRMMKNCYTHDMQRKSHRLNLSQILSGLRYNFKPPGKHETDCRCLLMGSFLGHTSSIAKLVNEHGVSPDVADSLGNSAVMYATCGDNVDIIHFLVDAGANVNSYNDSCCTPLGVALLRFIFVQKDISLQGMVKASLPTTVMPGPPLQESRVLEWNINRELVDNSTKGITRSPSKINRTTSAKRIKSENSFKESSGRKKSEIIKLPQFTQNANSTQPFDGEEKLYHNTNNEFLKIANDPILNSSQNATNPIPYIFEVRDMFKDIDCINEDPKKLAEKVPKKVMSKVIKDTMKPSKETMWNPDKDEISVSSEEKRKIDTLERVTITILQLLSDGANPKLVKCPQPALFIAIMSGCSNLIDHLVNYGADINEVYDETLGYTPLDLAVSLPFTIESLDLVRTILDCGANPNHRLRYRETSSTDSVYLPIGPTLFHAILARRTENEIEEEIQSRMIELLMKYSFNPMLQYKGQSAIDVSMSKNMRLMDVFVKSPSTNLNAIINDAQQTVLVKMFSMPFFKTFPPASRIQTITNLLLFGADPLLECENGNEKFHNLFVFAKKTLSEMENPNPKSIAAASPNKPDPKKAEKPKKNKKEPSNTKSSGKILLVDDVSDYKQAVDLVTECARLLHIRWLQGKLTKELIEIIEKYKHRHWNMIIKEHKHKKSCRLWLTTQRCLEIWDIMRMTIKKVCSDDRILKHLLHIVTYYNSKPKIVASTKIGAAEKYSIESTVALLLKERKLAPDFKLDKTWKKAYAKPELTPKKDEYKFTSVCFECSLPFTEEKIECVACKMISFCSYECMKTNVDRIKCHPCSDYLKLKYFMPQNDIINSNKDSIL